MKKFLGTFKGKVVAILLVVGIITGSGVVFASTGAGEQLRTWYASMFNQTVTNIEEDVTTYADSFVPGLTEEYESLKTEAGIDIDLSRELATGDSLEAIIAAKLEHIEDLDAEQQAILANIGLEFYNVFLDGYMEIQRNTSEGLTYATNDLTEYLGNLNEEAIGQMSTDITEAKDSAVTELEDAIRNAQEILANELDTQEEVTTRNLYSQVNWAVEDLRNDVTDLLDGMVAEQQAIIIAKAQELEDEAKAALDEVISGINK